MAADGYGTKGEPEFDDGNAPDTAVDPTLVAQYAGIVGNRIVGTSGERAAFSSIWTGFSGGPWNGLEFEETDTGLMYKRISGSWVLREGDSGWVTPTLNTGWSVASSNTPMYRRLNGVVYIRGRAAYNSATGGATTTLFTLPAGFRPAAVDNIFLGDNNSGAARLNVTSAGAVVYLTGGSVSSLSIASLVFIADN